MVVNRLRSRLTYLLFVAPAILLYLAFAIYPLGLGVWLSTTNWDGTAPWTPAQIRIETWEQELLPKLSTDDRQFLERFYLRDEGQGSYRNLGIIGLDRFRVMTILNNAGMVNKDFRSIGLDNYGDVLTGKVDKSFYPQTGKKLRFNPGNPILSAARIPKQDFENLILSRADDQQRALLQRHYHPDGDAWAIDPALIKTGELDRQQFLAGIPALADTWEDLFAAADKAGRESILDTAPLMASVSALTDGSLDNATVTRVKQTLDATAAIGQLKATLSVLWYTEEFKMGVLLFTVFFVVVNVLAVNILGLALALALDGKFRSANALRATFYIPNVLSMIIVSFIWQLVFTQLLPEITGIRQWMNNPELAPWITVFVATWQGLGYYIVVYHAGLQAIPGEIIESASIDGARGFRLFRSIILPLLMPAVTICLFLSLSGALKTFDIIFALYPGTSSSLGIDNVVVNIFYDAFRDKHAGLATAKAVLLMTIIMVITGLQLLITKRREVQL